MGDVTRFGYAGEYTEPNGYIYLRNRYYDPTTANFLTPDPLRDLTKSPYAYTHGNPLQFVDPLGLWGWNPREWSGSNYDTIALGATAVALTATLLAAGSAATVVGAPVAAALAGVATFAQSVAVVASIGGVIQHARAGDTGAAAWSAVGAVPGVGLIAKGVYSARYAGRAAQFGSRAAGSAWRSFGNAVENATIWSGGAIVWQQNVWNWVMGTNQWDTSASRCAT